MASSEIQSFLKNYSKNEKIYKKIIFSYFLKGFVLLQNLASGVWGVIGIQSVIWRLGVIQGVTQHAERHTASGRHPAAEASSGVWTSSGIWASSSIQDVIRHPGRHLASGASFGIQGIIRFHPVLLASSEIRFKTLS